MTRLLAVIAVVVIAVCVGGCGSDAKPPSNTGTQSNAAGGVEVMPDGCSSSASRSSASGATSESSSGCQFVLTDGRRFSCQSSLFTKAIPSVAELVHANGCRPISRLRISAALRASFAAIAKSRACMASAGLQVVGGPVLPHGSSSPDGELDIGNGSGGALIAYYLDPSEARRLESGIVKRTKSLGAEVERHGAVTVVWIGAASSARRDVRTCVQP
jgi:hypothetical protein